MSLLGVKKEDTGTWEEKWISHCQEEIRRWLSRQA
jgi:hypothetical protein